MVEFGSVETRLAFSVQQNPGVFALLIGSGVSRAAEIPTGWDITLDLVRTIAEAEGVPAQDDWGTWYVEKFGKSPDYSELLERLGATEALRRQKLEGYIEPTEDEREKGLKLPTAAHHAIAKLVRDGYIKVIITTNFDRLMENALREAGVEPTVVSSVDTLRGAEPYTHAKCFVFKIHGDYKDIRILNTDGELQAYPEEFNVLLDRILDDFGLIACGWSGEWDHALRAAILRSPNRRYPWFWASRGKLGERGQELLAHRKGEMVSVADADGFFKNLAAQVETIERSGRRAPADVGVIVARAKKYLSKPEFRIDFSDLVQVEVEKICTRLDQPDMSAQVQLTSQELARRFEAFVATGEGLNRLAALTGIWGDPQQLGIVAKAIRETWLHSRGVSAGYSDTISIMGCNAVLASEAACLGLLHAKRFNHLRSFLKTSLANTVNKADQNFLEDLSLARWQGGDPRVWKLLSGQEGKRTPFDNVVHALFVDRGLPELRPKLEVSENYLLLQALIGFMYAEHHGEQTLKDELDNARNGQYRIWMPVHGRIGWDTWRLKDLTERLETDEVCEALASAGFFFGKPEMAPVFIGHLRHNVAKLHW